MDKEYLPFADWLKTLGLALIVYGHVAAATSVRLTPPIYPKQLGVAFFVFVTGFTLARESRPAWKVLYGRLFEVYFIGIAFALFMSVVGLRFWGDANESNYMPFVMGVHLFQNDFPANPTTWYIGTYLHLLLLWVFAIRRLPITKGLIAVACAVEIVIRAFMILMFGRYVAYMFVANWLTVFLVGLMMGSTARVVSDRRGLAFLGAIVLGVGWPLLMLAVNWEHTFPFMSPPGPFGLPQALGVSVGTSAVYVAYTCAAFAAARTLRANAAIRFFARNTVFVFIAHMPVYYLLEWLLLKRLPAYGPRVTLEFVVCLVVLAVCSEGLNALLRPRTLRDRLGTRISRWFEPPATVMSRV
jgi:hypothetical protein